MHTASVVTLGMGNKNYTFFRLFQSMLQTHKKRIMHTRHSYTLRSPCPGNFHHHYQPPAVATFCFYRSLSKPQETIIHKRFKPFVLGRNSQVGRNVWKGRIDFPFVVERLSQKYRKQCCQHCRVQTETECHLRGRSSDRFESRNSGAKNSIGIIISLPSTAVLNWYDDIKTYSSWQTERERHTMANLFHTNSLYIVTETWQMTILQ